MPKKTPLPCHYYTDKDGTRYFIPGCMGRAVYGEDRLDKCTCNKGKSYAQILDEIREQVEELASNQAKIISRLSTLELQNKP